MLGNKKMTNAAVKTWSRNMTELLRNVTYDWNIWSAANSRMFKSLETVRKGGWSDTAGSFSYRTSPSYHNW